MQKLTKWLNQIIIISSGSFLSFAQAQNTPLTLDKAYLLAEQNYPVIKQRDLVKQTAEINIENLNKGYLPQVTVTGQASYQSDVTTIDLHFPGFDFNPLSKDQYKIYADINQNLFDGNTIKNQSLVQETSTKVEDQKLEVELYKVNDRINQIYFGVLMMDEQAKQIDLVKKDLESSIEIGRAHV